MVWIPNQVGDDIGVVFGDDNGCDFEDDSYYGSSIKDFKDDIGVVFEDDNQLTGFSVKLRMTKEDRKK